MLNTVNASSRHALTNPDLQHQSSKQQFIAMLPDGMFITSEVIDLTLRIARIEITDFSAETE